MGNLALMNEEAPNAPEPEPEVDDQPERAPGGADADVSESDVGAASEGEPVIPESPLSAQQSEDEIPDELQTPEEPEVTEAPDDEGGGSASEPTG
jgi:hypothetical protein